MAKIDVLDILRSKKKSPLEFDYDNLWIPPMDFYLTMQDVEALNKIATSLRLSSKIELKYKMIDDIMRNRGFKRFAAGTNRVVYSFLEDTRFVVKIAVDRVGMQDNPLEFENQHLIKPYCSKMFYISPCGTVGFAERVLPIKNRNEFKEIASDVFDILVNKILGKYVVEDVGTKYFMNFGIRANDGPVLLDYPFIYKLDGKKLFCTKTDPSTNIPCNGEIDYDAGFNHLVCNRCGKIYLATDLKDDNIDNKIIIKGGIEMRIELRKGDQVIGKPVPEDEVMIRQNKRVEYKSNGLVIALSGGQKPKTYDQSVNAETDEKAEEKKTTIDDLNFNTSSNFIPSVKESADDSDNDITQDHPEEDNIDTENVSSPEDAVEPSDLEKEENIGESTSAEPETATETDSGDDASSDVETDEGSQFDKYDTDDDAPSYQPIRKKGNSRNRDANGRFVSSNGGSKKVNRIPSK